MITCVKCGKVFKGYKTRKYCEECTRELNRERARKNYKGTVRKNGKLCSCGCGRPVGKDLRFLSDYCFANKDNDDEHGVGK